MIGRTRLLTLALGLVTALALAAPASSATCAEKLIDDWADNAEIDGTYPIACYRAAINALPEDLRAYSSAADDIRRAQQELIATQSSSSGGDDASGSASSAGGSNGESESPGGTGSADEGASAGDERDPQAETQQDTLAGVPGDDAANGGNGEGDGAGGQETVAAPSSELFGTELDDGGSSIPLPIVVLLSVAGLAAVVVAGWLVSRQLHRRRPAD